MLLKMIGTVIWVSGQVGGEHRTQKQETHENDAAVDAGETASQSGLQTCWRVGEI